MPCSLLRPCAASSLRGFVPARLRPCAASSLRGFVPARLRPCAASSLRGFVACLSLCLSLTFWLTASNAQAGSYVGVNPVLDAKGNPVLDAQGNPTFTPYSGGTHYATGPTGLGDKDDTLSSSGYGGGSG